MAKKTDKKKLPKKSPAPKKVAAPKKAAKPAKKVAKPAKAKKPAKVAIKPVAAKAPKKAKLAKKVVKKVSVKVAAKPTPKVAKPVETKAPKKPKVEKVEKVTPEKVAPEKIAKKSKAVEVKAPSEEVFEEQLAELDETTEEVILTDAEGRRYCRVKECDQLASVEAYCRYHYLLYWKKIQVRKKILTEGKLERYVEELTSRYPDKFLEMLRKDLRSDKDFQAAIQELELDESSVENDSEEETQTYIDEVRGMAETGGARDDDDF